MTKAQSDAISDGKIFDQNAIRAIRTTGWALESKAKEFLVERYGQAEINQMIILEYEKAATGIFGPLVQMVFCVKVILAVIFGPHLYHSRTG